MLLPIRLRLETISKQFSLDHALTRVSLELRAGERLTLLGGRGSGKSTLAAILGGELRPDGGQLQLDDRRYAPRNAREAREAGVASIISARWALPQSLTVAEALLLGIEPERMGWINRAQSREKAAQALAALRWDDIPLDAPLIRLPESHRRRVALAKALMGQPRLIVLDEPGPLSQYDTEVFFSVLHERVAAGASLLLLSRSVDEARAMGGRVAILSRGELVGEQRAATMDAGTAIALMGGTPTALMGGTPPGVTAHRCTNHRRHRRHRMGRVLLALHGASGSNVEGPVSLTVREGEIVGLAGLPGSGRRSLLRLVAGLDPLLSGDVHLFGRPVGRWSARRRMRAGLVPGMAGDEHHLMDNLPVAENLLLPRLGELGRLGSVPPERKQLAARDWMEKLRIRPGSTRQKAGELARINRWKVALGRVLRSNARVLLLDDFSAGVDRPAREELHGWLAELAAEGRALLIAAPSTDLPDLLALCDTIGVMRRRKLVEIRAAADWSPETLQQSLSGHWCPRFQPSA